MHIVQIKYVSHVQKLSIFQYVSSSQISSVEVQKNFLGLFKITQILSTLKKKMTWNWHSALTMHVLKISHKCFSFPLSFQGQLSLEKGYSFIQIISKWIEYPRGTRINFVKTCTQSLKYWLLFFFFGFCFSCFGCTTWHAGS